MLPTGSNKRTSKEDEDQGILQLELSCVVQKKIFIKQYACHKMQFAAFNGPSSKPPPPYRRKNLADVFHISRDIANFVSNFVGMATGVSQGKMPVSYTHLTLPTNREV